MTKLAKIINRYYTNGTYTKEDVAKFVTTTKPQARITEDEYKEITGDVFGEPSENPISAE